MRPSSAPRKQRGVTLVIVLVFVLLSTLLALWASRTAMFNELVVGNDADYQRAFEAAQALLQDAELDIRGEQASGSLCSKVDNKPGVCRTGATKMIPLEAKDITWLLAELENLNANDANKPRCDDALCAKRSGPVDFWNNPAALAAMTANNDGNDIHIGARYGAYTGATLGSKDSPANPILAKHGDNEGGWYWIEVLPYDESSKTSGLITSAGNLNLLPLNLTPSVVYRITAVAYGLKPSTQVVLQETYAQQRRKD